MTRASTIAVAAAVAISALAPDRTVAAQQRPPNIVVIVTDDMGYADVGFHGSTDIVTPNIDALAAGGVRFTDAYVSGPYCSPTRAGLLTGRYPQRFGHEFQIGTMETGHGDEVGLPLSERTLADRLKAAGYVTGIVGKWHLGAAPQFRPESRGFDEFFGFLGGAHSYMPSQVEADLVYDRNNPIFARGAIVSEPDYLTDVFADQAVDFIQRHKSRPFFLYLAFSAPHIPMQVTEKYKQRFLHIADEQRRTYAAMVSAMDDGIGRTMTALRQANLDENTLVFFLNDNGGAATTGGINGSSNAPLRGSKRQTWEGGIRVPFVMRWKSHLPEGTSDQRPIIQLDVFPTALGAAGVTVHPEWRLDGVNLLPFLTGAASGLPHETLYWRLGGIMAIRRGDWKLVKMTGGAEWLDPATLADLSGAALFNLKSDIRETNDLAATRAEKVRELAEAWQQWNAEMARPAWPPPRRPGARRVGYR